MKRKGWHNKKRRLRHDWRQQYANTLWNAFKRFREDCREHARMFEAFVAGCLTDRNAGHRPTTDNERPNV
jgi:hypothetical protein